MQRNNSKNKQLEQHQTKHLFHREGKYQQQKKSPLTDKGLISNSISFSALFT